MFFHKTLHHGATRANEAMSEKRPGAPRLISSYRLPQLHAGNFAIGFALAVLALLGLFPTLAVAQRTDEKPQEPRKETHVVEFRLDLIYAEEAEKEDLFGLRPAGTPPSDGDLLRAQRLRTGAEVRGKVALGQQRDAVLPLGTRTLFAASGQEARLLIGATVETPRVPNEAPDPGSPQPLENPLALPPPLDPVASSQKRTKRDFGMLLRLIPMIGDDDRMLVRVQPEVRGVDFGQSTSRGRQLVPQLVNRRSNQLIEVAIGQTFVISGLFRDEDIRTFRRIPAVNATPLIQRLIKLRQERPNGSFLVLATPRFVQGSLKGSSNVAVSR